ncbi:MAG: serine/threonine protein kinase [Pseudanabaena sp.]|nr:MAG: serine/threonine protein kinase [Pseudanabaena sp.]
MSTLLDNRYRVTSVLGCGGFGETYMAEDTKMPSNRRCVIKQLRPIADNPQMYELLQQRFQREAAVLEALGEESRYIPKLYANFVEDGLFYLVQEWIDGLTLAEAVKQQGPWTEDAARTLMISILQTLTYVHSQGIIHRDIKPDNIILRAGEPVLIDFGAVKETLNITTVKGSAQQAHSIVIGTPGFMASEQAAGRPFFASDLYSLALTVIYALTAKYPQQIGTDPQSGEVLWQPQVSISPELKAVFTKALQFDPRDRYSSAQEMLKAMEVRRVDLAPMPKSQNLSNMQTLAVTPRSLGESPAQPIYTYQPIPSKRKALAPMIATVIIGVGIGAMVAMAVVISQRGDIASLWNRIFPSNKSAEKTAFYFLADSAFEDSAKANLRVEKLRSQGYTDAGVFWIPDYPNLGNSQFFQVYAKQYSNLENCRETLTEHSKLVDDAYCAFASPNPDDAVQRISVPTPSPTSTPTPTATATLQPKPKTSPEQFIKDYYNLINERQFERAWQNLTPTFQRDRAGGYQTFTGFWQTIDKVDVRGARIVEVKADSAIIDIDLTYQKSAAITPETLRMGLVWQESSGQWLINTTQRQ